MARRCSIQTRDITLLPRLTQGEFVDASVRAKTSCVVPRLLHTNISMNAKLEQ
jgi:hypothetical protein